MNKLREIKTQIIILMNTLLKNNTMQILLPIVFLPNAIINSFAMVVKLVDTSRVSFKVKKLAKPLASLAVFAVSRNIKLAIFTIIFQMRSVILSP
jgi:hypothetical protein